MKAKVFVGKIDDVRTYNRALSTAEIAQLYHLGSVNADVASVRMRSAPDGRAIAR